MASKLPYELLENIFSNLDSKCLIKSCRGVCRTWRDLIDDEVLMRRALVTPELRLRFRDQNFGFQVYYQIEQTFGRNLLKNIHFNRKARSVIGSFVSSLLDPITSGVSAEPDNAEHWSSRGPFVREKPPIGVQRTIPHFVLQQHGMQSMDDLTVVATSYSITLQSQDVVLAECGIGAFFMDQIKPIIVAEEWIGTRFDCGNKYSLMLELFTENSKRPIMKKTVTVETIPGGPCLWKKVSLSVKNYGPGVRRIRYSRQGQDNQFWVGHYGTKFAFPSLALHMARNSTQSDSEVHHGFPMQQTISIDLHKKI